jgi:hypothetical protein
MRTPHGHTHTQTHTHPPPVQPMHTFACPLLLSAPPPHAPPQATIEFKNACTMSKNVTACSAVFDGVLTKGLGGATQTLVSLLSSTLASLSNDLALPVDARMTLAERASMRDWVQSRELGEYIHHAMGVIASARRASLNSVKKSYSTFASKATVRGHAWGAMAPRWLARVSRGRGGIQTAPCETSQGLSQPCVTVPFCLGSVDPLLVCRQFLWWWRWPGPSLATSRFCVSWMQP